MHTPTAISFVFCQSSFVENVNDHFLCAEQRRFERKGRNILPDLHLSVLAPHLLLERQNEKERENQLNVRRVHYSWGQVISRKHRCKKNDKIRPEMTLYKLASRVG